jgi:hypothetical protein
MRWKRSNAMAPLMAVGWPCAACCVVTPCIRAVSTRFLARDIIMHNRRIYLLAAGFFTVFLI